MKGHEFDNKCGVSEGEAEANTPQPHQIISPLPNSSARLESDFTRWLREDRHLSESTVKMNVKNLS